VYARKVKFRTGRTKYKSAFVPAALSAATRKKDGELHEYYVRKVAEGKNRMSIINNAARAKLVLRMFAAIRVDKLYDKNYAFFFCINHKNNKAPALHIPQNSFSETFMAHSGTLATCSKTKEVYLETV
jgi:hypothetical protein